MSELQRLREELELARLTLRVQEDELLDKLELARLELDEARDRLQEEVAAERERCAQVCERVAAEHSTAARIESELDGCRRTSAYAASRKCAREIRNQAKVA